MRGGHWTDKALCGKDPNPKQWDADAGRDAHREAAKVCGRCSVTDECRLYIRAHLAGRYQLEGLYAGRLWSRRYGEQTIDQWHRTHGKTGRRIEGHHERVHPIGWSEDRECASPECSRVFIVYSSNLARRACSDACAARINALRSAEQRRNGSKQCVASTRSS